MTHPEEMEWGQEDAGNIQCHIAVTHNQRRLAAQVGLQLWGEKDPGANPPRLHGVHTLGPTPTTQIPFHPSFPPKEVVEKGKLHTTYNNSRPGHPSLSLSPTSCNGISRRRSSFGQKKTCQARAKHWFPSGLAKMCCQATESANPLSLM